MHLGKQHAWRSRRASPRFGSDLNLQGAVCVRAALASAPMQARGMGSRRGVLLVCVSAPLQFQLLERTNLFQQIRCGPLLHSRRLPRLHGHTHRHVQSRLPVICLQWHTREPVASVWCRIWALAESGTEQLSHENNNSPQAADLQVERRAVHPFQQGSYYVRVPHHRCYHQRRVALA